MGRRLSPPSEASNESDDVNSNSSRPLPEATQKKRPGTSGTENLLMTTRREASQNLQKAQRAERAYRSKKRAAAARAGFREARGHFKEARGHLRSGFALMWSAARAAPYVWSQRGEERRRARSEAKRKQLREELAREGGDEGEGENGNTDDTF
ncbi:hypothetical protein N3K66_002132 [Trichothecium roseum]|uniref:Uncharacterized protein n=1 Tax=Trichothecium roseum TaxID=47278 RepID=A0ACC0VAN8_9HYPO|nr:hypothetical protein N3K66_002132 [Trichothecium roseum]